MYSTSLNGSLLEYHHIPPVLLIAKLIAVATTLKHFPLPIA